MKLLSDSSNLSKKKFWQIQNIRASLSIRDGEIETTVRIKWSIAVWLSCMWRGKERRRGKMVNINRFFTFSKGFAYDSYLYYSYKRSSSIKFNIIKSSGTRMTTRKLDHTLAELHKLKNQIRVELNKIRPYREPPVSRPTLSGKKKFPDHSRSTSLIGPP